MSKYTVKGKLKLIEMCARTKVKEICVQDDDGNAHFIQDRDDIEVHGITTQIIKTHYKHARTGNQNAYPRPVTDDGTTLNWIPDNIDVSDFLKVVSDNAPCTLHTSQKAKFFFCGKTRQVKPTKS